MASSDSTNPACFRLLLHGRDGSIPYLTPALLKLVFCPDSDDNNGDDGNYSGGDDDDRCWRWHRRHFVLGVAVKDACVAAVYREGPSSSSKTQKKKRKNGRSGDDGPPHAKRAKTERSQTPGDKGEGGKTAEKGHREEKNEDGAAKKPSGYAFLVPSKADRVCAVTIGNRSRSADEGASASTGDSSGHNHIAASGNYMRTHLRIPPYISTLIVPTFSLDPPKNHADECAAEKDGVGKPTDDEKEKKKKYAPKKPQNNKPCKQKQQQQQKGGSVVPVSTKDSMPVNTPHGWQRLRPEQYWDAATSLTRSDDVETDVCCEGAVGTFDHAGVPRDRVDCLFAKSLEFANNRGQNGTDDRDTADVAASAPRTERAPANVATALSGKWGTILRRLVQRTNDWSFRTATRIRSERLMQEQTTTPGPSSSSNVCFWTPVHLAASGLPADSLWARTGYQGGDVGRGEDQFRGCCPDSNVAIVGWDAVSFGREHRRRALQRLVTMMNSDAKRAPNRYLVLSVSDLQSVLDAARGGVSIIGTDMVRQWSRDGKALCLDLTLGGDGVEGSNNEKADVNRLVDTTTAVVGRGCGGLMDLGEDRYAHDSSTILPGRKSASAPAFSRAYIHHLLRAKEMLAETLLFVHNLRQMLSLMRRLSEAASSDATAASGGGNDRNTEGKNSLEAFCRAIEAQL